MNLAGAITFFSVPGRRPPRIYPRVPPVIGAGPASPARQSAAPRPAPVSPKPRPPRLRGKPRVRPSAVAQPSTAVAPVAPAQLGYPSLSPSGTFTPIRPEAFMADEEKLRRKVLLRLIGHPLVLGPAVLGCSASTWLWAFQGRTGPGVFALLAGLLVAFGAYFTRALLDGGRTARKILEEMELQKRAAWNARLDGLDRRLVEADQDPRPETALRDLRALLRAFDDIAGRSETEHWSSVIEVYAGVQQLFEHSVHSLEQTMRLYATAGQLRTPEARQPILDERERILSDIQAGIAKLGAALVTLQRLGAGDQARSDLAQLRTALDDSLQLAQRVEQRLHNLLDAPAHLDDSPLAPSETQQPLKGP